MSDPQYNICVFAPSLLLTVTVEAALGPHAQDDIHFHPGGQGFWVARMLQILGERPVVVAPVGGESGRVLQGLAPAWNVFLSPVRINHASPCYLHDRRSGTRRHIAQSSIPSLNRHELDDLYGQLLRYSAQTRVCVVTGRAPGDDLPLDFFTRLAADLAALGVTVVGDLHGDELAAFLAGGPLHTLKLSDSDLVSDRRLVRNASLKHRFLRAAEFARLGAQRVIISSADHPTVALFGSLRLTADTPTLQPVDHRGSGDAMTAALTMAAIRNLQFDRSLQLACAAGAANVTRHGLASADAALVDTIADHVCVKPFKSDARR